MSGMSLRSQITLEIEIKRKELAALMAELEQLDFDAFVDRTGIRIGSVVLCQNGKRWQVSRIEPYGDSGDAWVYGYFMRDDGVIVKRPKLVSRPGLAE